MEEFDEDDFSDLYADVEVQASSAISAMHRSTEIPPRSSCVVANAARGAEIGGGHRKFHKGDAATEVSEKYNGGGMRNLPVEDCNGCESRPASESEDLSGKLNSDSDDGVERILDEDLDNEKYHYRESDDEIEEISGKEKTVDGRDHGSKKKILKHNSSNSDKKRVNEMGHIKCEKGNVQSRDPLFNRACADKQPNYKWKHGEHKIVERHTQACYPMPLDVDKHGSVQISDSVEDSPHEGSECDTEGVSGTSHDTNRRKVSCINNKFSSRIEQEPTESSQSQHGRGYSYSPSRDELGSRYFERNHKRSRYSSSSLQYELQEPSESRVVKRGTEDGRYHKRWRDGMREYSNRPNKSNFVSYFKNLPDEDASYAIDTEHHSNKGVSRGKPREMDGFPYFSQSKRILTGSGGIFPYHHLGPAFLKGQYRDSSYCRYKSGRPDGHNMNRRRNSLDHKSIQMDYEEALEHNRYQNQRRYPFQGDIKGLRNLAPKYSSAVAQRDTQLMYRGDSVHHRRRTRQDCLSPLYEYDERFVEGKDRRIFPNSDGDRDRIGHSCNQNVTCDRREVERYGRDKRSCHSPVYSPGNFSYIGTQVIDSRTIKYRPEPFYPSEEPYAFSRWEHIGVPGKRSGTAQRNIRCLWKEMHFEYDQCGTDVPNFVGRENVRYHPSDDCHIRRRDYEQSPNASVMRDCIKDNQYQDHFADRRHHHRSERLHSREDVFKPRQQDNVVSGADLPSYHFKKNSRNFVYDRHAFCRVVERNEREKGRQNSSMLREEVSSKHFDGFRKSSQLHSHDQMLPSSQDSADHSVVIGRKCTLQSSIRRTTEAGEDTFYGRRDLMECNENETKTVQTDEGNVDASLGDRNKNPQNEFQDIEEGQIITEEMHKATKCINVTVHPETATDGNGIADRLDDEKIREIMMKMERRRERFKEPIALSRDSEKTSSPLPESHCETAEVKLERPARKRTWLLT